MKEKVRKITRLVLGSVMLIGSCWKEPVGEITLYRGNLRRDGVFSEVVGIPSGLKPKWSFMSLPYEGDHVFSPVLVHRGILYSTIHAERDIELKAPGESYLWAIDPETGEMLWKMKDVLGIPAFYGNFAYVHCLKSFKCLDLSQQGAEVWSWSMRGEEGEKKEIYQLKSHRPDSSPLVIKKVKTSAGKKDLVVFCSPVMPLVAVEAANGQEVWRWPPPEGKKIFTTSPSCDGRYVYIGVQGEEREEEITIYAIDVATGIPRKKEDGGEWKIEGDWKINNIGTLPLSRSGVMVLGDLKERKILAFSTERGKKLWEYSLAGVGGNGPQYMWSMYIFEDLCLAGVAPESGKAPPPNLIAIDLKTGAARWTWPKKMLEKPKPHFLTGFFIAGNEKRIYIPNNAVRKRQIFCLDLGEGKEIWRYTEEGLRPEDVDRWASIFWPEPYIWQGKLFVISHWGMVCCFEKAEGK
jgi:outer membrane protein assembly factor BamB